MNAIETKNKKLIYFIILIAVVVSAISVIPSVQNSFQRLFLNSERKLLGKVLYVSPAEVSYLILKVKDSSGLAIEIYDLVGTTHEQKFKQKFELLNDSDAFITIDKNSTNLALSDANGDEKIDVLVPSVDQNGNLRLSTFVFNEATTSFEPLVDHNAN